MFHKLPSKQFLDAFTPEVNKRLVKALDTAYTDAVENYKPSRGSNGLTFGIDVYSFACHQLRGEVEKSDSALSLQSRNPSFRIRVADFEIGCHRVGNFAKENIWNCFPGNKTGVKTLVDDNQGELFPQSKEVQSTKFILAHLGNPEDGLSAVYLCAVKRLDQSGQIAEWDFVYELWRRSSEATSETVRKDDKVPEERIETPVIARKAGKDEDKGHG